MAEAREQLTRLQDIRERAKDLPHPRVLTMLDNILHQVRRRATGAEQNDSQVAAVLRAHALEDEERTRAVQTAALAAVQTTAKATARPAKRKRSAMDNSLGARARRWLGKHVQLHLPRHFDARDLGQGRPHGGGKKHYENRFELFLRVLKKFDTLDPAVVSNIDRTFRHIDDFRRRDKFTWKPGAYGSRFRDDMQSLLDACKRGERSALAEWINRWLERVGQKCEVRA